MLELELLIALLEKLYRESHSEGDVILLMYNCLTQTSNILRYNHYPNHTLNLSAIYNKYKTEDLKLRVYTQEGHKSGVVFNKSSILTIMKNPTPPISNHFQLLANQLRDIRHQYDDTVIIDNLSELFRQFHAISEDCETHLIEFLNKIFNNELRQLSNIPVQLEESQILLNDEEINRLASLVDLSTVNEQSTFTSFQGFQNIQGFKSNDKNFTNLFYFFLQILGARIGASPVNYDFTDILKQMLHLYKSHCMVSWIEIDDDKLHKMKFDTLVEFFLNPYNVSSEKKQELTICTNLVQNFKFFSDPTDVEFQLLLPSLPEMKHINTSVTSEVILLEDDRMELINNVNNLIPQLSGFTFDFDSRFQKNLDTFIQLLNLNDELVVSNDLDYLNDMIILINKLVDYDNEDTSVNGEEIYQTAYHLYQLHKLLSSEFDEPDATDLMKFVVFRSKLQASKMKRILKSWNLEVLTLSQLEHNQKNWSKYSDTLKKHSVMKIWMNSLGKQHHLIRASDNYYNKKLQLAILLRWLPKLKQVEHLHTKETEFITKKTFSKWLSLHRQNKEREQRALDYNKKATQSSFLSSWKSKDSSFKDLQQISIEFDGQRQLNIDNIVLKYVFNQWTAPVIESGLSDKLKILHHQEKLVILSKYFEVLKQKYLHGLRINQIIKSSNVTLVKFFFQKWKHLHQLKMLAQAFDSQRQLIIKRNLLLNWQRATDLNSIVEDFQRRKIVPQFFKNWKLKLRLKLKLTDLNSLDRSALVNIQTSVFFKKWQHERMAKDLVRHFDTNLKRDFFIKWVNKILKLQEMQALSLELNDDNNQRYHLKLWLHYLQYQKDLPAVADSFYERKFFSKIETKFKRNEHLELLSSNYMKDHPIRSRLTLADEINVHSVLKQWKLQKKKKFQESAEWKLIFFNEKIVKPNMQRLMITLWVQKYNLHKSIDNELSLKCDRFLAQSNLTKFFFSKWKKKLQRVKELEHQSGAFEQALLYKKFTVIWYDRFVATQHLEEIAQQLQDQKEWDKQNQILNDWSMKYFKITRNHQSCDMFIKRWDSSKMKSLFELWHYKLQEHRSNQTFDAGNQTENIFLDDLFDSPLDSRKRSPTYLSSPVKEPNTPSTNISPSRIQTSIRLKNQKIQALKNHYGKARDSVSRPVLKPVKTERFRLSPPERPNFSSTPAKDSPSPPPREFSSSPRIAQDPGTSSRSEIKLRRKSSSPLKYEDPSNISVETKPHDSRPFILEDQSSDILPESFSDSIFHLKSLRNLSMDDLESPPSPPPIRSSKYVPLSPLITSTSLDDIETAKRLRKIKPIIIPESDDDLIVSPVNTIKRKSVNYQL